MKTISIKELIAFRHKSERAKQTFVSKLRVDKVKKDDEGGGDYWVSCTSALNRSYYDGNFQTAINRMSELEGKLESAEDRRIKNMYRRNISVLQRFETTGFKSLRPAKIDVLRQVRAGGILPINGYPINSLPSIVFKFDLNGQENIGAIWITAKLTKFRDDELGMFADAMHRYLKTHYENKYHISAEFCIALDVVNAHFIRYSQLERGEISMILTNTVDEIAGIANSDGR